MKKYLVELQVLTTTRYVVMAEDEQEAISKAGAKDSDFVEEYHSNYDSRVIREVTSSAD